MKILFLCTAHNSLSQRLYLALTRSHDVTIEYALSEEVMISAAALAGPDLVICPFLTTLVPREVYDNYMTLIIHPGPPGDAGPSALDWVLMGDDGSVSDSADLLRRLDGEDCANSGRTHWGITVLQAIEEFDAGPVWAFEQFPIDIDQPSLTKSELYRGPVTHSAITATLAAISRIQTAATSARDGSNSLNGPMTPQLAADPKFRLLSVSDALPFQGGNLHHRPLLKAAQREFDISRHTSLQISRRIKCGDSQPGVLSKVFGPSLYVYGGMIDDNAEARPATHVSGLPAVLGFRNGAVCLSTFEGKGIWITHVRRMKTKADKALWPKVPATFGLLQLGLITYEDIRSQEWNPPSGWKLSTSKTFQEVWVDFEIDEGLRRTAYVYFDFYNGAMSTDQCSHLIDALDFVLSESTPSNPIQAVVMMGGAYFSNGIALNVIEAAADPAVESWSNINCIDDVVYYLLHEFPTRGIITVAAIRGNAAAGGVALAAACDVVVAGQSVVLNPAYRAVGLYGSEYHTLTYYGRCGKTNGDKILRSMTPLSPLQAQSIGLVDYVFPGSGALLDDYIRTHIAYLLKPGIIKRGLWKKNVDLSPSALARARARELAQMSLDFFSARSVRYHTRRFAFVRKLKATHTPLRFATHNRALDESRRDEEETDEFDSVDHYHKLAEAKLVADLRLKLTAEVSQILAERFAQPTRQAILVHSSPEVKEVEAETKMEPIFSCYYKAPAVELLTPPESPLSPGHIVDMVTAAY